MLFDGAGRQLSSRVLEMINMDPDAGLERSIDAALEESRREQEAEIAALEALVSELDSGGEQAESGTGAGTGEAEVVGGSATKLDLKGLWEMSKNTTDAAETPQARARALTRELMNFWRRATPENTPEDQEKRVMLEELGGRNVTFAEATRERLRLLQRHRAAGLVEYRIFGEVLSRSDDVLSGLPGTELVDFDTAWRDIGVAANLTGWLDDVQDELAQQQAEDMEAQREFSRSLLNSTAGLGLFNESELEQLDAEVRCEAAERGGSDAAAERRRSGGGARRSGAKRREAARGEAAK